MVTKISDFLNTTFSTLTLNDAVNNSVVYPGTIVHTTTGTPGSGIGAGLQFQVETSNNNNEYGMMLETITTDVTAGSEDFDFIVKLMQNGAAAGERLRLNSAGQLTSLAGMVATSFTPNGSTIPTNGMYLPTTNTVGFATNATDRMRILPTGNVGIGIASPAVSLQVDGSGAIFSQNGYNFATASTVGSAGDAIFGGGMIADTVVNQVRKTVGDNGHFIALQTTEGIRFHTGFSGVAGATFARTANERMRIDALGNVSIGTTGVFYPNASRTSLSINGTSQAIMGLGTGGTQRGHVYHDGSSMYINADTGSVYIGPIGSNLLYMQTSNVDRMRITSAGNVTIGTPGVTTPAGLLVVSNYNNSALSLAALDASTLVVRNDSVTSLNVTSKLNFNVATIGSSVIAGYYAAFNAANDIGTGLIFGTQTNAAGGTVERMRIDANGNVSIGNSSSLTKLSVTGETSLGQGNKLTFIGLDLASGGTPTYIKIRTRIPITSASADFTVNIKGFAYSYASVCDLKISWHYYLSTFYNPTISSSGGWAPTVKLSGENGVVCIVLYTPSYWPKLYVESMYSSNYNDDYASGWTWVDEDATGTPLVTLSYKSDFGNRFVMATDGYVGIGTTIPRELLHLNNPSAAGDTPRIKFTNTNTGGGVSDGGFVGISNQNQMDLWNNEASLVRIGTSGTERMRVDASGNVSIGTNLVGAASFGRISLTVNGTNGSLLALATGDTLRGYVFTDTANMSATCMGGTMTVQTAVAQPVIFATNSTERMRINSVGNVGIGSTAPLSLLDINGFLATVTVSADSGSVNAELSRIDFRRPVYDPTGVAARISAFRTGGASEGALAFSTNPGGSAGGQPTERMRIDTTGFVGIGTITPNQRFHVFNGTGDAVALVTGGTGFAGYITVNGNNRIGGTGGTYLNSFSSGIAELNNTSNAALLFSTNNTERMRIDALGNVSIGTTSVFYTLGGRTSLSVNGTTSSIVALGTAGAAKGYVFHDGSMFVKSSSGPLYAGTEGNNALIFQTANNERMRIDSVGNVGIGTSTIQTGYKLQVEGDFAATTKSFVINHPTKPGKMLRYGSLESPYHGVRLTGEAEVIDGKCTVDLPDYISGLCKQEGSQVQITNIKHGKTLWIDEVDVENNMFTVKTRGKGKYRFYWSFTAVRKDIEDMMVEFDKFR